MTRREFLKYIRHLIIGAGVLYIGRVLGFLKNPLSSRSTREAKFYRQADDLAG